MTPHPQHLHGSSSTRSWGPSRYLVDGWVWNDRPARAAAPQASPSGTLSTIRVISTRMSRLETHLEKARTFQEGASQTTAQGLRVEAWFLSAYHFIEACAAKHRLHIQKHQRIPRELRQTPRIFGAETDRVVEAFLYLDNEARAKFVYGASGTDADLERARESFETIRTVCEGALL